MSRNLKKEYINKLIKTAAPNGYKFDIANYLYNPSYDCDYPAFIKTIEETPETITIKRIYYFKHYDGSGEYIEEVFSKPGKSGNGWSVTKEISKKVLEESNRFSLKKILEHCI